MGKNDDLVNKYQGKQQGKSSQKTISPEEKKRGQELVKKQVGQNSKLDAQVKQVGNTMQAKGVTQGKQYTSPPPKQQTNTTNERYRAKELNKATQNSKGQQVAAKYSPTQAKQQTPNKDKGFER